MDKWMKVLEANPEPPCNEYVVESQRGVRKVGYFIAMDARNFDRDFAAAYERDCEIKSKTTIEKVFIKDGTRFETFVDFPSTEYRIR
jgi:hypothetical protein